MIERRLQRMSDTICAILIRKESILFSEVWQLDNNQKKRCQPDWSCHFLFAAINRLQHTRIYHHVVWVRCKTRVIITYIYG